MNRYAQKALEYLFADEKRAAKVARAVGAVQRVKATTDARQAWAMHQVGLAVAGDYKAISKKLSKLRARTRAVSDRLDRLL